MDFPNVTVPLPVPQSLPAMVSPPAVITVEVPKVEVVPSGIAGKARVMIDTVSQNISSWKDKILSALPKNFTVWLIAITCLIVLVAVSRILTLQKSVTELQSRPVVDENMIRVAVRKHLEETVKAMEQHNKAQAMARQAEEAAKVAELQRQAAEQQRLALEAAEARKRQALEAEAEAESKRQAAELEKQRESEAAAAKKAAEESEKEKGSEKVMTAKQAEETLDLEDEDETREEKPPTLEKKKSKKVT